MNLFINETNNENINSKIENIVLSYNKEFDAKTRKKNITFYLEHDDEILGGLVGAIHGDYFEIDVLAIQVRYRQRGYGTELLKEAEKYAKQNKCKYMLLYTTNYQGIFYYPKFGFKLENKLEDYPIKGQFLSVYKKNID